MVIQPPLALQLREAVACCSGESLWCLGDSPCVSITDIFCNSKDVAGPSVSQGAERTLMLEIVVEPKWFQGALGKKLLSLGELGPFRSEMCKDSSCRNCQLE